MQKFVQNTMKKTALKFTALSLLAFSNFAFADAASELQTRLSQVNALNADFEQTVTSGGGKNVQQGSGKIQIKRPNLFRMDTKTVKDAVNNTPFVLLTSNDKNHWNQYTVTQQTDTFVLKPKSSRSNIKQFDIRVDANGVLRNFSTTEKDGQTNLYVLRNITNQGLSDSLFQFTPSKGVEVDDQRKK